MVDIFFVYLFYRCPYCLYHSIEEGKEGNEKYHLDVYQKTCKTLAKLGVRVKLGK